ncbi:hypothetical protein AAVH_14423 [Aphelenchoides avenae]|nr:hypothetical protein AAVH_14423 [Aphelenchus avenae]
MECKRKSHAVCYYYRENSGQYHCPQDDRTWMLFRGKCYYRYYGQAQDDLRQTSAGNEVIKGWDEATWIELQTRCYFDKTNQLQVFPRCYWNDGERRRIDESDRDPTAVDRCSRIFSDIFPGQWEDRRRYNHTKAAHFRAPNEPNQKPMERREKCLNSTRVGSMPVEHGQSRAYCLRGVNGTADFYEHCAQIFPAHDRQIADGWMSGCGMKRNDVYCFSRKRGYICERNAVKSTSAKDEL